MNINQSIKQTKTKMEAKQIYLFPLVIFFLLFTFSLQAQSSPIIEKNNSLEKRKAASSEFEKAIGIPDYNASDHTEWMLRAVGIIMEKKNWTYHFNGDEKPDVKKYNTAKHRAFRVILGIIEGLKLNNPYRPYYGFGFSSIFYEIKHMEKENPVYPCFEAVWPACMARAPATPDGEMVYRFECGWKFKKKC